MLARKQSAEKVDLLAPQGGGESSDQFDSLGYGSGYS